MADNVGPRAASPLDVLGEQTAEGQSTKAKPSDTVYQPGQLGDATLSSPLQQLADAFPGKSMPIVLDSTDGLPRPVDVPAAVIAPFSHETQVCIEDDREWVEVFHGEPFFVATGDSIGRDSRVPGVFKRERFYENGDPRNRRKVAKTKVHFRFGVAVAEGGVTGAHFPVRPVRPRCIHYDEQMMSDAEFGDLIPMFRYCSAMRTVGGAKMGLFDQPVFSCSMRSPHDAESFARIQRANERKMEQGRNRVFLPMFQLDAPTDWRAIAVQHTPFRATIDMGPGIAGKVHILSPEYPEAFKDGYHPPVIVLADKHWQPEDPYYGERVRQSDGQRWGATSQRNAILRLKLNDPGIVLESDAAMWPETTDMVTATRLFQFAQACGTRLKGGEEIPAGDVAIVGGDPLGVGAFFAAVILFYARLGEFQNGLDALDFVKSSLVLDEDKSKVVPSMTHRTFLRVRLQQSQVMPLAKDTRFPDLSQEQLANPQPPKAATESPPEPKPDVTFASPDPTPDSNPKD